MKRKGGTFKCSFNCTNELLIYSVFTCSSTYQHLSLSPSTHTHRSNVMRVPVNQHQTLLLVLYETLVTFHTKDKPGVASCVFVKLLDDFIPST